MSSFGYARTSTTDQQYGFEDQIARLTTHGCIKVYQEQVGATNLDARVQWKDLLNAVKSGDEICVTKIDRVARSVADMVEITATLATKGVTLNILDMQIDTKTAGGAMMLNVFMSFAQFERDIQRERQAVGIAKAKAEGKYKGRAPTALAKTSIVLELHEKKLTKQQIANATGIGIASVYRILKTVNS
jgi:DNA invertase Pin-like site-specific DNA recombinase